MAAPKKKPTKKQTSAKTISLKRRHRRLLSFIRICRYGVSSFRRNAWLTVAATIVMTITLLIILVTGMCRNILVDTVSSLRQKVDMSIYVQTNTSDDVANQIAARIRRLSTVDRVHYVSPAEARAEQVQQNKNDNSTLDAINEANTSYPGVLRVNLKDMNNTSQLEHFTNTDSLLKQHIDPDHAPSFAGDRRTSIQNIGKTVTFAERAGLSVGFVFVIISSLIIFNTIRMSIFNRREEINMMQLIGAERSFIRGPFLVEATIYAIVAAIIATAAGITGLYYASGPLENYSITVRPTLTLVLQYAPLVLLAMILLGALIGIVSSYLATRRYLKL